MTRNAVLPLLLLAAPLLAQPLTPADAVAKMKLPDGFSARCVASEPMIRQPLSISFDGTGRLWVLQYLQYPNPEGLKPVKQDQYLRTQWDKVLDPPPKGPKGLDKITICYDPDEHGVFRKSKDFVTGLNVASGFCLANDGVYVLQAPYLLFYPDKNHDDVPDGDPEVLVKGFGLDDTHSLANSLQFGPDGWLYGAAGSTSTSRIEVPLAPGGEGLGVRGKEEKKDPLTPNPSPQGERGTKFIEFQQGVWRYHPKSKRFELFSEGGGNTYGLDFDANGQCIAGTNWGGFACLHHLPGAYYVKGFSKHGPLHNPHAYGYFDHVPYKNFKGGHVTCGGIIYDADTYPKEFRGQYIAGNLLSNAVYTHKLTPKGASFTAEHGTDLLIANDDQFRPVDLQLGPDGCVYVADWYDKRAAHLDPLDTWDKTNGRVYKIEYTKPGERRGVSPPVAIPFDIRKKSSAELVELLKHPNVWWRRAAREHLAERDVSADLVAGLRKQVAEERGTAALEALWAVHAIGKLDAASVVAALSHADEHVRAWGVRLTVGTPLAERASFFLKYHELKDEETSPVVIAQMAACSKSSWESNLFGPLYSVSRTHPLPDDPALSLMLWWGLEPHVESMMQSDPCEVYHFIASAEKSPVLRFSLERLARKIAATNLTQAASIAGYNAGTFPQAMGAVYRGLDAGLTGASKEFNAGLLEQLKSSPPRGVNIGYLRLLVRLGEEKETSLVVRDMKDAKLVDKPRIDALQLLALAKSSEVKPFVLDTLEHSPSEALLTASLAVAEGFEGAKPAELLLARYPKWSATVKKRAVQALLSRKEWASELFTQLDAGKFPKADVSVEQARAAVAFNDKELTALVEKHFGKLSATAGEKQARIASLNMMLGREKPGDAAKGKVVFTKSCGACHQLFGEGGKVGPDLTTADRKNRGSLLASVVDPSGYIRPEYVTRVVNTLDGRTLSGVVTAQSADAITVATYTKDKVEAVTLPRKEIDKMSDSGLSLMPEKLLDTMSEPDIRDLFAYLSGSPLPEGRGARGEGDGGQKEPPHTKDPLTPSPSPSGGEGGKKLKLALVSGADEYKSNEVMPVLQKRLEDKSPVECVRFFFTEKDTDFSKLDKLKECDAAVFFTRRLKLPDEQVKAVKAYCESGKPVIGIRTASHGFQTWLEMDTEVYGGNYKNHYKAGDKWELKTTPEGDKHPILKGVKVWASEASLYRNTGAAKDITILMTGGGKDGVEPVTWTREREVGEKKLKQRVFYTSLGHQKDFEEENFLKLVVNGIAWATQDERIGK